MFNWLFPWRHDSWNISSDIVAGLVVAILIIPQAIGYGFLAHLPPSVALASCIFPLLAYAVFGRSHALAVGPVAIISLMVGNTLQSIPLEDVIPAAQLLALQIAMILAALRILQLGGLVHYIGHPVVEGFSTAAAIIIISKQLKLMLGADILKLETPHIGTALFATTAILILISTRKIPHPLLNKAGPLMAITLGCLLVAYFPISLDTIQLDQVISPVNLSLEFPWQYFEVLLPSATLIAIISFFESTTVAKNLAKANRRKVHSNQELMGLSFANFAAAIFHGYPVAGGFGRSMVNLQAGASSPLAGVFTALFVGIFLLFAALIINFIPMAALGAIVTIAVWPLLDFSPALHNWRIHPKENSIWVVTFLSVLWQGVEIGILAGVLLSIFFLLRSAAKPHMAIIGRIPGTAHFRNIKRHHVQTDHALLAIRIDEGLHFANRDEIEAFIDAALSQYPHIQHLLIVCSAVNVMDSDGLELLQILNDKLNTQGKQLHLAEVKGPIMDDLEKRGFIDQLSPGQIFLSTHDAFEALSASNSAKPS